MTTTDRSIVKLNCPPWCHSHQLEDAGDGINVDHVAKEQRWSDAGHTAWIIRRDLTQQAVPAAITIAGDFEDISGISAVEARRLANILVQLADKLEKADDADG